ncbi:DUF5513 family protein [Fictibacillus enclensis]|uniref:DUF5513 family protein n=1 Tax=Fictibacillus enclensis TaxID=1017270 RepID=UPI0025A01C4F|nr:DUF5513 family protein [Fictibacillus enclensis]MDM5335776.1 DUF5513 family protein [Fictibacillus enclensis]
MITTIENLKPQYDYSKNDCYLVFYHNAKPSFTKEIKAEWFDLNYGNKVLWLLVREKPDSETGHTKYTNIKFENVDPTVKVVQKPKG